MAKNLISRYNTYGILQRHPVVSPPQHGFVVYDRSNVEIAHRSLIAMQSTVLAMMDSV